MIGSEWGSEGELTVTAQGSDSDSDLPADENPSVSGSGWSVVMDKRVWAAAVVVGLALVLGGS
ncbi:hypothetical protein [Haloferax marisrubri]|uniref:Uncharacterized protein n=1 Tax=Haloferax marisrubri TaxID=1544719 RepID=A0A2P4NU51_9EURY|nr:hypothetical protein [Haloferax marisrubri]POG56684.1 hypothetical protein AUR65_002325 [Haloferax marisrubri]